MSLNRSVLLSPAPIRPSVWIDRVIDVLLIRTEAFDRSPHELAAGRHRVGLARPACRLSRAAVRIQRHVCNRVLWL